MSWQTYSMKIMTLVFGIFCFSIFAQTQSLWSIKEQNNRYVLDRNGIVYELEYSTVKPVIKKIIQHEKYEIVIYLEDVAGTTVMVEIYSGAIYSRSEKKIIAFEPYKYINVSDQKALLEQPKWTFNKDGSIVVTDPESGSSKTYN